MRSANLGGAHFILLYTFGMSPLFGKKRSPSTIAVLDIESGSVGSALVTLARKDAPGLLGQDRSHFTLRGSPSAEVLLNEIEREIEKSLTRLSSVSTNLSKHDKNAEIGRIAVFLHAPWSSITISERAKADTHDATLARLKPPAGILGLPVTFHSFAATTMPVVHGLFGAPQDALVISIGGEVSELSLFKSGAIAGYATVPVGVNTVLRTLAAHGGLSRHEARSVLTLSKSARNHAWAEALSHGARAAAQALQDGAGDLLSQGQGAQQVFILSNEPAADFFARALTDSEEAHALFSPGSTVRAVLSRHTAPHLRMHPPKPDPALM